MKTVEEVVSEARARERALFDGPVRSHMEEMLRQIDEKGYFTAGLMDNETLKTPFLLLLHPLPFEGDHRMFHNHNCFELVYVYRGSCRNLMRGFEVTLCQGDLLLMNPMAVHCLCADGDDAVIVNLLLPHDTVEQVFLSMHTDNPISDFFTDYLHRIRTGPDFLIVNRDDDDALDALMRQLILEYHGQQPGYNTVLQTGLVQLFVYMARRCSRSIQALPLQSASRLVRSLILYIAQNAATVTLADAAREFSYHEKHISRQMKKELGMSFNQFLRRQRLRNASQLLAHTNMPVSQIAREVGYQNVSHFYDLFQEQYAMTPAAWRATKQSGVGGGAV